MKKLIITALFLAIAVPCFGQQYNSFDDLRAKHDREDMRREQEEQTRILREMRREQREEIERQKRDAFDREFHLYPYNDDDDDYLL